MIYNEYIYEYKYIIYVYYINIMNATLLDLYNTLISDENKLLLEKILFRR